MGNLLGEIERTPEVLRKLIDRRNENNANAIKCISEKLPHIAEIVIIGSGSSLNEAKSARGFIEEVTKIRVVTETSNDFIYNHDVFPKDNLYIFMSQSGTSETTRIAQKRLREMGCVTIAITSEPSKFLATEAMAHIDSMASDEAYMCVTLGYAACLVTVELFAISLAEHLGTLKKEDADEYIKDLQKAIENYPVLISKVEPWFKKQEKKIMGAHHYAVYGADRLWGIALEGALKIMEIPKLFAVGYELEDGTHGPTLAFDKNVCLFVLNDGKREDSRALSLANFMKAEYGYGYVIGTKVFDEDDLKIETKSQHFQNLEFACTFQTVCWYMSVSHGIDLDIGKGVGGADHKYFSTHSNKETKDL